MYVELEFWPSTMSAPFPFFFIVHMNLQFGHAPTGVLLSLIDM